jgi:hypothetical protein
MSFQPRAFLSNPFPPAIPMKTCFLALALCVPLFCARAEDVLPAEMSYDPPEGYVAVGPSSADPGVVVKYVNPENTPESHREVSFGFLLPDVTEGLEDTPNLTALGKKLREKLASPQVSDLSAISETTVGGRPGIHASYRVVFKEYPGMPVLGMHVYWIPVAKARVLQIVLTTTPADKLPELRSTLKSVRFKNPAKAVAEAPLPVATGKVSLGDERSAVYSACGKPPSSSASHDAYYMEPFVTTVNYKMPHVTSIYYVRPTDAKKLVTAIGASDNEAIGSFTAPLTLEDVKTILALQAPADAWKPAGENRWERADGAVAFHWVKKKLLLFATKETWPRLTFPE